MNALNGGHHLDFSPGEDLSWMDHCPCLDEHRDLSVARMLGDDEPVPRWQPIVVSLTLVVMFGFMMTDYIGPDWVMVAGVTLFMVTEIITVKEGLAGFSSAGILTVMALFVVAEGVSRTGALDHYMGMVLGRPKSMASAQIRITIPIAILSAFLNNTPIVAVMIPLTLRWAKNIGVPKQQLLIPLSYATILGGTCTLVGTSTNLVVQSALEEDYPDIKIGLFTLGKYGVPNAIIGIIYMLLTAPYLLPNGKKTTGLEHDEVLLGARVTPWSPASGRTVKRSGLTDTGGVYLVYVKRAATGNVHHTISDDFVLSVGDELYFTGSLAEFGAFCEKQGLEIITTDKLSSSGRLIEESDSNKQTFRARVTKHSKLVGNRAAEMEFGAKEDFELSVGDELHFTGSLAEFTRFCETNGLEMIEANEVGTTKASILETDEAERQRLVNKLSDQIQGRLDYLSTSTATKIVVTADAFHSKGALLIAIDTPDRADLIVDISKTLAQQGLQNRHTEAKVIDERSLSIWRTEAIEASLPDIEEVWTALSELLSTNVAATFAANNGNGPRIYSATITKASRLVGKTTAEIQFRDLYKAGIIAYQKNGKNAQIDEPFEAGDTLVLEISKGSPLLQKAPAGFYEALQKSIKKGETDDDIESDSYTSFWKDLKIDYSSENTDIVDVTAGEFVTAFTVPKDSSLIGKSLNQASLAKLPGVVLVSIERPLKKNEKVEKAVDNSLKTSAGFKALSPDDPLQIGDVFWYTGSAEAIGDLRKIQGLVFYQDEEMKKAVPVLQDRRLVQAVIARGSPLIAQTIREVRFRTVYGGAVISIQRGSDRVHDHPGSVKLQTGDVLLIDAPPTFVKTHGDNYRTFALVAEVDGSSPPRPALFLLCVALIVASLTIAALEIRDLVITASIVGIIFVSLGIVTQQEARDCLQWDLFVVVACAFGVSSAMQNSGVAEGLAKFLVRCGKGLGIGDAGVYGAVYLAGNLLSAILTNNAAAQLTFPIAMSAVDQTGADRVKMTIIVMMCASDYITSFGYQTNLMVYGPGEYSNFDYFKFGAPMQTILWLAATAMVAAPDNAWPISWAITAAALAVVCFFRLTAAGTNCFHKKK